MSEKRKSTVWKFFALVDAGGKKKTECNLCHTQLAYHGNTSTMAAHLKGKHPHSLSSTDNAKPKFGQLKLTEFKKPMSMSRQRYEKITSKMAAMCARDLRPLSIVEGAGFRDLFHEVDPSYQVPTHNTVRSYLGKMYQDAKSVVLNRFADKPFYSLTADIWSSLAQQGYLTITCHHLDDSWKLVSQVLSTRRMEVRHTGQNIANEVQAIMAEYGLDSGRLACFIHDNASNMDLALRIANFPHLGCFGHTLQLSIQEGLEDRVISNALAAARNLVAHFKRSTLATDQLHIRQKQNGLKELQLMQSVVTRWGSTYQMCERLIQQRLPIFAVLQDRDITSVADARKLELSDAQWVILEQLVSVLKPLHIATKQLGGEEYPTLGLVYPVVHALINVHLTPREGESAAVTRVKGIICQSLTKRFNISNDKVNNIYLMAALLDPRYKSLRFASEEIKSTARALLFAELQTLQVEETSEGPSPPPPQALDQSHSESSNSQCSESEMRFLLGDSYECIIVEETRNIGVELDSFIREPAKAQDALSWWAQNHTRFPTVAVLARKWLTIPATSIPSERLFSAAGNIVTKKRASLDSSTVDELLFVHYYLKRCVQTAGLVQIAQTGAVNVPVVVKQEPSTPNSQLSVKRERLVAHVEEEAIPSTSSTPDLPSLNFIDDNLDLDEYDD